MRTSQPQSVVGKWTSLAARCRQPVGLPCSCADTGNGGFTIGTPYLRTEVGAFLNSASPFGYSTFDQGGNVFEWNETAVTSTSRGLRGGSFYDFFLGGMLASTRYYDGPASGPNNAGFCVANPIPEPGSLLLAAIGAATCCICGRKLARA